MESAHAAISCSNYRSNHEHSIARSSRALSFGIYVCTKREPQARTLGEKEHRQ